VARPREFDMAKALDGAMDAFWDKGYGNTTLPDLLKAMKLTRGSFYKAFESKHAVYLAALKRYDDELISPAAHNLENPSAGLARARIAHQFEAMLALCGTKGWRNGCFLCKASVDMAPHDKNVEKIVNAMMQKLEHGFVTALKEADTERSARQNTTLARQLTASFFGIQVMRTAGVPQKNISDAIAQTLMTVG
jgi:TetR/AcrR family transcriptional regulator, transcriptional repressor for nem operon